MSDFLDQLTRKLAYVAIGEFKPGKFAEARDLYEQAVSTYTRGFKGAYLLQEPGTDKGIAVIFWENIDDMDANQQNEAYTAILKQMSHLFLQTPTTAFYEVCSEIPTVRRSQDGKG
jgi:heme-degrading monooxygenase HmoA